MKEEARGRIVTCGKAWGGRRQRRPEPQSPMQVCRGASRRGEGRGSLFWEGLRSRAPPMHETEW